MSSDYRPRKFATKMVHSGEVTPRVGAAVSLPVFQSSTFELMDQDVQYDDIKYIRMNNTPNHDVLGRKLAALGNAEAGLAAGSGMAAITAALLAVLKAGDHLLAQDTLYGGSHSFISDLASFGIEHTFVDGSDPGSWEKALRKNTRAIYVESISNPLMIVPDLEATVDFAKAHGLISMVDNTFPSPFNFRPVEKGFDLSLHSASKYLNGHSDIVAGAVLGSAEMVERVKKRLNYLGGTLDPHACFLFHRGLKTLALRMRQQNASALALAEFLEAQPQVSQVAYPGLRSHPAYERAARLFEGFSGMLSFELSGGEAAAVRLISALNIPIHAPSLGGVESLITRPCTTSHVGVPKAERERQGISQGLIRVSVGVEDTEELIDDFRQALA